MLFSTTFRSNPFGGSFRHHRIASALQSLRTHFQNPPIFPQNSNPRVPNLRTASSLASAFDSEPKSVESMGSGSKPRSLSSIFAKPPAFSRAERPPLPNGDAQGSKPRSLFSIFSKPAVVSGAKRPPLPGGDAKKERKRAPLPDSSRRRLTEEKGPKELSPEAASLVSRLEEEGYLKNANFSKEGMSDASKIPPNLYSHHFLKSAAERFGQDHQEIAKWLSGSDLKRVALFGCPSVERKTVFAAKRLRAFFRIQEDVTCRACKLRSKCKFPNQRVASVEKVLLNDVMRILTLFAFDVDSHQLLIPSDAKLSVGKLLKESLSLSS